jgi:hypothetical protein
MPVVLSGRLTESAPTKSLAGEPPVAHNTTDGRGNQRPYLRDNLSK